MLRRFSSARVCAAAGSLALVMATLPSTAAVAAEPEQPPIPQPCAGYERTDLHPVPAAEVFLSDLTDRGRVVGTPYYAENLAFTWDRWHGFRYFGPLTDVATLPDNPGMLTDELGRLVWSATRGDGSHAVFRDLRGRLTDVGTLGGADSVATDLNERGALAGWSTTSAGIGHAFYWTRRGGLREPGDLGHDDDQTRPGWDVAVAVNDRGQVVVRSVTLAQSDDDPDYYISTNRIFFWDTRSGRIVDLGPVPPYSTPDLNNHGLVMLPSRVWDSRTGRFTAFPQDPDFEARQLNERGEVVGRSRSAAVYWNTRTGRVVRTDLPYDGTTPFDINDHGLVVLSGADQFEDWAEGTDLLWRPRTGQICRLGSNGTYGAYALLVNERGTVAGDWGYGLYLWTKRF
jgi:uncharacterized membrane protein